MKIALILLTLGLASCKSEFRPPPELVESRIKLIHKEEDPSYRFTLYEDSVTGKQFWLIQSRTSSNIAISPL